MRGLIRGKANVQKNKVSLAERGIFTRPLIKAVVLFYCTTYARPSFFPYFSL
jgi:hypothetical protein